MPSPITVLLERASFGSCESYTLEKSRSKEERPAQAIFRQMQTDASKRRWTGRESDWISSSDKAIPFLCLYCPRDPLTGQQYFPLPNLPGRLSQDVGHGLYRLKCTPLSRAIHCN